MNLNHNSPRADFIAAMMAAGFPRDRAEATYEWAIADAAKKVAK